ncbi:MAG: T9SS type A sorting domain-containing protein, partial [Bacteroidetes bacterium]|nr:T9SS type A sorting domain-containing protein [Bacteroidota bacterium]
VNGSILQQGYLGNNLILKMARMDDLNGDGFSDIVPAHSGFSAMAIDGYTGQIIWSVSTPDKPWNLKRIPDISGDSINDIALGTLYQSNYAMFLDGVSGETIFSEAYGEAIDALGILPDMNGDGSWEMVAGGREGKIVCYAGGPNAITSIQNYQLTQKDFVSAVPNPFTERVNLDISIEDAGLAEVKIYNLSGTLVWEKTIVRNDEKMLNVEWNGQNFSGQSLPQGIYFYEVKAGKRNSKGKLIKIQP